MLIYFEKNRNKKNVKNKKYFKIIPQSMTNPTAAELKTMIHRIFLFRKNRGHNKRYETISRSGAL